MNKFQPFANEEQSLSLNGLTIENGSDKVSIYGSLDVTRDKAGLKKAKALKTLVDAMVRALEQDKVLPEKGATPAKPKQVKNPFA